jgi:hypothetical protein
MPRPYPALSIACSLIGAIVALAVGSTAPFIVGNCVGVLVCILLLVAQRGWPSKDPADYRR